MLQFYTLMMKDAIELNIQTAKHAHATVLQEIDRGRDDWKQLDILEKIKNVYTQRLVQNQKSNSNPVNTQNMCAFQ